MSASLQNSLDEKDYEGVIRLLFQNPLYVGKVIIVIEGNTDVRLFRKFLQNDAVELQSVDGKKNVLTVMDKLLNDFPNRILAICDADYDHLKGVSEIRKQCCIYLTDQHDAEVMMLISPALDSFIDEYSSNENIETISSSLLEKIFEAAYPIGLLRWINEEEKLSLKFKALSFDDFTNVERVNIDINIENIVNQLLSRSPKKSPKATKDYILSKFSEYSTRKACPRQVCCGHDLSEIIARVYKQSWASVEKSMNRKKVESSLRMSFHASFFQETQLFKDISVALTESSLKFDENIIS